ncbi:MAG: ATP synthase F0 subunit C [Alphaproteobacteria bacterium]|nr:ATP synthase F0 subunit C [Alphaproteobacteria bacterium]
MTVALTAVALFLVSTPAFAQDGGMSAGAGFGLGAGLSMGLAALGCGMGQGRATASAVEGIARNPQAAGKIQTPMIIGLVFIETLVLFTFAFGFMVRTSAFGG